MSDDGAERVAELIRRREKKLQDVRMDAGTRIKDLGLSSRRLVELIIDIEDEFDILIDDEELTVEMFDSVGSLAEFVSDKAGARQESG